MTRVPDWHSRYNEFIEQMRRTPFQWGVNDCGPAWAGHVVSVLTGAKNPLRKYEGEYDDALGAVRVMRKTGHDNLKDAVAAELDLEPVHPSQGYIGDIAVIKDDSPFKYSLGIVNGERVFFRTENGIGTLDLLECDSVFKV